MHARARCLQVGVEHVEYTIDRVSVHDSLSAAKWCVRDAQETESARTLAMAMARLQRGAVEESNGPTMAEYMARYNGLADERSQEAKKAAASRIADEARLKASQTPAQARARAGMGVVGAHVCGSGVVGASFIVA